MDTNRIKHLIQKREEIDRELVELVTGNEKKGVTCSLCNESGHTARSCPTKQPLKSLPAPQSNGALE